MASRNGGRVFQPAFPHRWAIKSFPRLGSTQVKPEALGLRRASPLSPGAERPPRSCIPKNADASTSRLSRPPVCPIVPLVPLPLMSPSESANRFGVKLNNGKLLWIVADSVRVENGAILFLRSTEIIAGFNLSQVNHFGVPQAFATDEST